MAEGKAKAAVRSSRHHPTVGPRPQRPLPRRLIPLLEMISLAVGASLAGQRAAAAFEPLLLTLANVPQLEQRLPPADLVPPAVAAVIEVDQDFAGDAGAPVAAAAPAPAAAPPAAPATPEIIGQAGSDRLDEAEGEYGIEYQLSFRDAGAFLNRMSATSKALVEQAMSYLGTPYRRGGASRHGVDCSGLVGMVFGQQGVEVPRTASRQFSEGVGVLTEDLRPGDLVFFRDTYKRGISHVGIYIGDGRFIHAAGRRAGVIVSALDRPYYKRRYAGARRLNSFPDASEPIPSVAATSPAAVTSPASH
jgi:cell wall-associated NlpC family hydrolase